MNANNRLEMFLALNADAFRRGLNNAGAGLRNFSGSVSTVFTQVTAVVAPITALVSATAGLAKLVGVSREFDKLSAGLITATGSAKGATEAFAAIQDFATRTPYDLAQVTDSFVKLVNFGLNPSQRAMTSYGNTSSALGKDLNQMIEAVADAATGEFERLKEFGIRSRTEGDKVSFTFRGITETVGKNAKEIEDYLIKLGETNFGDAMANRMSSLDGALSNLGDEWDKLFLNISQQGIGDAIADGVRVGISALEELNAMIVSGELEGYLKVSAGKWSAWADDVGKSIKSVGEYFGFEMDGIEARGTGTVAFLVDAFRNFPENVRAFIGILAVEVAAGFDRLKADATAFKDSVKAIFTSSTLDEVEAERLRQLEIIRQAREESIDAILKERNTAVQSADAQIAAVKRLRSEWQKKRDAERADTTDKTEKFKVKDAADQQQPATDHNFNIKPDSAKFVEQNGEWVQIDPGPPKTVEDETKQQQDAEYQKQLAEKRKQLTAEEFQKRQAEWQSLEDERPLTKDEEKQRKAEEAKFKKDEAERKRLEKETRLAESDKAKQGQPAATTEPARQWRIINGSRYAVGEDEGEREQIDGEDRIAPEAEVKEKKEKKKARPVSIDRRKTEQPLPPPIDPLAEDALKEEENAERRRQEEERLAQQQEEQNERNRQFAEEEKQRAEEHAATAEQAEQDIATANADRIEASKTGAEEWGQAEAQAAEKAKSAFQKYADKVKAIQDDIAGREKSLAEELDVLDNRGTAESKWRRKAKEAKDYERAAKAAIKAGELDQALSLSDKAKASYSALQGGAGSISDKLGNQAAFRGVKSSGLLGIDIAKALQQATAKTALTAMPVSDMFGDLSARIRGQLAAMAGGEAKQGDSKGAALVTKVVELRFPGGSLHGNEDAAEAFLNLLAKAGMNTA